MNTFLDCPSEQCSGPLEVQETFILGNVACGRLACVFGHEFVAALEWLQEQDIYIPHQSVVISLDIDPEDELNIWQWLKSFFE